MIRYKTVAAPCDDEIVIERSRFIGHIAPVNSRDEADEFIKSIKASYKDASHNVPAFIIGEHQELVWASDDGEPSGTSGMPIAQLLQKEGLTNVCVVVTRYFGGIKLGTGGLSRAYSGMAKQLLEKAGTKEVKDMVRIKIKFPYQQLEKLQNAAKKSNFIIEKIEYFDELNITLLFEPEQESDIISMLSDFVSKQVEILEKFQLLY